jgi:hypothetical protein
MERREEQGPSPAIDFQSFAKLWPNRTHESNWLKAMLCALGWHRWYRLDIPVSHSIIQCSFCRWCPKVKAGS